MIVTLMKAENVFSITLPEKVNGRYWISDIGPDGKRRNLISVEGIEGQWVLGETKKASLVRSDDADTVLKPDTIYNIKLCDDTEGAYLYSEVINDSRKVFKKLVVVDNVEITIGRDLNNVIHVNNTFVSSRHATLTYFHKVWTITDENSTNGTYVNDSRVSTRTLAPGDIIFIMGLKIIIGSNFIAVNNPDNTVTCNQQLLYSYAPQSVERDKCGIDEEDLEREFFYRSPRFKRDIEISEIKIEPPPTADKADTTPMALVMGPSVTMGMASVSTGAFSVINAMNSGNGMLTAMPTVIMSGSMLLGMILWPILTKRHEKKKAEKRERFRQAKYKDYLFSIRDRIIKEIDEQSAILFENNVSTDECIDRIMSKKANLWERVIGQDDFLKLRLGLGTVPYMAKINYPDRRFTLDDDNLQDELSALMKEPKNLTRVPITYSFAENRVCGIIGENRLHIFDFVSGMIVRMTALHSYDELKLVFIASDEEKGQWGTFRWMPHVWDDEKNTRFFATTIEEAKEISVYLEREFTERVQSRGNEKYAPYYVIFNMNREVGEKTDIISMILGEEKHCGFSIINVESSLNNLPKECSMVIETGAKSSKIYDRNDISGKSIEFEADMGLAKGLGEVTKSMANIDLDVLSQAYALPDMLTFIDMFRVNKIEYLNPLMRWKNNNPTVSLAVPIGVDTMGQLFTLDLHERFQGPHGLVAGMTGSGKSEFIITYILSMAVNFHPDEVAFILIDYKGGGLTGAFEDKEKGIKLPHLAGTITNLDGAAVKRSLISIQSELRRRQAIFNEARRISNEGTMDIYKYQKLYRDKIVSEPVPHLFIISDEFAELKSQQPEFMAQLISAARIGRSLGVHLILATQKPSGVVDDQIWSNSRFRVCLKVQEKADSVDMIKRPEAAELSNTGRFYLQVGFNEYFALGQSAWCGATYYMDGNNEKKAEDSIKVIDNIGRVIKEVKPDRKIQSEEGKTKQIVAMVRYLSDLAAEEHISVRPLWLDAMPAYINLAELIEKYNVQQCEEHILNPVIGELDDPFNQSQTVLAMNFLEEGNMLVYGVAGSGKLTFLTTMIYELINSHKADYLNLYILDFGAETLKMFAKAPQVGDVVLSSETEKVINLMKMLKSEMVERKKLFSDYGGDYISYVKNSGKPYPNIVVMINNYSAFAEMYELCEEVVAMVSREGTKYGIYFVVTATNASSMRFRIVQNFKRLLVLQMNDKTDYSAILGPTEGVCPSAVKGRGIIKNEHTYEFQIAQVALGDDVNRKVRECISRLTEGYTGKYAKRIPILPDRVDGDYLLDTEVTLERFPVGINKVSLSLVYHNIAESYISLVLSQSVETVSPILQGMAEVISDRIDAQVVVIDSLNRFAEDVKKTFRLYDSNLEEVVVEIFNDTVARHKEFKAENRVSGRKVIYIINSLEKLKESLSEDGKDKLNVLLENGRLQLNMHFIIGDSAQAVNKITFDSWYKKHCGNVSGVWAGDGSADQYILKITKPTSELYQEIADGFGLYISKGRFTMMKILTSRYTETEDE